MSGASALGIDVPVLSPQLFLFLMSSYRRPRAVICDEVNSDPFDPEKDSVLEAGLSFLPTYCYPKNSSFRGKE